MRTPRPRPQPARFEGFADTSGRFFAELRLQNDREWFEAHRREWEEGWQAPMRALMAELRGKLARAYPGRELGEPKVFRIHRDVRFSADKSPYKTHVGGVLVLGDPAGRQPIESPAALYFQVSFEEAFAGYGLYRMDPETLARHRAALLDPRRGAEVARIVARLQARGCAMEAAETLKRVPAGLDPEHPRAALLRMKGLTAIRDVDRRLLVSRRLVDRLAAEARAAAPLVRWLARQDAT